jgi:hypothetical protein
MLLSTEKKMGCLDTLGLGNFSPMMQTITGFHDVTFSAKISFRTSNRVHIKYKPLMMAFPNALYFDFQTLLCDHK